MTVILDAGALVAVERADRPTLALLEAARRTGRALIVPAGVVGQVWRDGTHQARLARFLAARGIDIETLSEVTAKAAGVLCGRAGTADVVDASVIVAARRHRAAVVSSDRKDLETLDRAIPILDC